ncbi:MAG: hypothetical protein H7061_00170 [Bdellovibrionaceae bacterium]|nr:hypothetical protein [Bdellovibrio sp.]
MKSLIFAASLLTSGVAFADGFACTTASGLNVQVYNHTNANVGTRTASVMIISDQSILAGNKTVARFTDANGTLTSSGARFEANVDLRFNDSARKGELLAGTKLGNIDRIYLTVDHNYAKPVEAGKILSAVLQIVKRDGGVIEEAANCLRYLKQ